AEELAASFKVPAGGKLNKVDIPNPHFAMCMRTLHEFAVEDWSEYELALKHYETKPWYYHALPDHVTLPPR
ncbi:MAG: hypothetical protein KDL10_02440, partial [Kiritimatiellae bacterium]|nr:hypothetical protein [Kiritimatiellia bacterium]